MDFSTYTIADLRDFMRRSVRLACSFYPKGGDSFYLDAEDAAQELERRGCTVLDDWSLIRPDGLCIMRAREHDELPED